MKHWTKSDIKAGKEFGNIGLWLEWIDSVRKIKYNESNWITTGNLFITSSKIRDQFEAIPFMSTTNKIAAIIVNVDKSATTPLKQIRLKAYDPDTLDELAYTNTNNISATSKQIVRTNHTSQKLYLSYSYSILAFTPTTTYVNDSGFPIKKRVLLKVEIYTGSAWETLDSDNASGFVKFIEIGPDTLTGGIIAPYYNQTIPDQFFSAFYSLVTGDLYDESVGLRYLNYIIPAITIDSATLVTQINIRENTVLNSIIKSNMNISGKINNVHYEILKIIGLGTMDYGRVFFKNNNFAPYDRNLSTTYTKWKEYDLIDTAFDYGLDGEEYDTLMFRRDSTAVIGDTLNLASASILPGFLETAKNTIFEFAKTAVTQAHRQPIDNISMSIINNTFKLPFWKNKSISDVVQLYDTRTNSGDEPVQLFSVKRHNGYFDMVLELSDTGTCDIVEATAGLYVKFYV